MLLFQVYKLPRIILGALTESAIETEDLFYSSYIISRSAKNKMSDTHIKMALDNIHDMDNLKSWATTYNCEY